MIYQRELESYFDIKNNYKVFVIYGQKGYGKSHVIYRTLSLKAIAYKKIVFSEETLFPLRTILIEKMDYSELNNFIVNASKLFTKKYCLVFENMEKCSRDNFEIIYRLLSFRKEAELPVTVILEYNCLKKADMISPLVTKYMVFNGIDKEELLKHLELNFYYDKKNDELFTKIIKISHRNLQNYFLSLNILEQAEIIKIKDSLFYYADSNIKLPDNLLSLYILLFEHLDSYLKDLLTTAAPFSLDIYIKIISHIFRNYDNFEEYLDQLCAYKAIIKTNENEINEECDLFHAVYSFTTDYAREAILSIISQDKHASVIAQYYRYLEKAYQNKRIYSRLKEKDQLLLLINLTKKRRGCLVVNQIPYIVKLMEYYYGHFLYFNVIELGRNLIKENILNEGQLNQEEHRFYLLYFESFLATAQYEEVVSYNNIFKDEDLNFFIAIAFYNNGQPLEALNILNKMNKESGINLINIGKKYSLKASIFDWIGKNREACYYFKKALKYVDSDEELKYHLYKKYSMHVDFELPECQDKMKEAVQYYQNRNLRQYAECLHNYGTDLTMIFRFSEAENALIQSIKILHKLCIKDIYHPLNSLAILYSFKNKEFERAIKILEYALKYTIEIDFCKLALKNNLLNLYIHNGDWNLAENKKDNILKYLQNACEQKDLECLKQTRPDIQHELRHFYYNCACLCKRRGEKREALNYFYKAKNCSEYHSIAEYSILKNIEQLEQDTGISSRKLFKVRKIPAPTKLEKYMHENEIYLCIVMYWG